MVQTKESKHFSLGPWNNVIGVESGSGRRAWLVSILSSRGHSLRRRTTNFAETRREEAVLQGKRVSDSSVS